MTAEVQDNKENLESQEESAEIADLKKNEDTDENEDQYEIDNAKLIKQIENLQSANQELEDKIVGYEENGQQRELEVQRKITEMGQSNRQMKDFIKQNLQSESSRNRNDRQALAITADPVLNSNEYTEQLNSALSSLQNSTGLEKDVLPKFEERFNSLENNLNKISDTLVQNQYNSFLDKERTELKSKFGLNGRDLKTIENFARQYGEKSLKSAAWAHPKISSKMEDFLSSGSKRKNNSNSFYKRVDRSNKLRKDFNNQNTSNVVNGASQRSEQSTSWRADLERMVENDTFWDLPKTEREEYERKLLQAQKEELSNNKFF